MADALSEICAMLPSPLDIECEVRMMMMMIMMIMMIIIKMLTLSR